MQQFSLGLIPHKRDLTFAIANFIYEISHELPNQNWVKTEPYSHSPLQK